MYSQAELNDLLRRFLKDPEETKRCGSIELEVTQVTVQPPFLTYHYVNISQREILKRWVYFVDFHEASNLIGHEDIQQEVLGAWVAIGGQFEHHVTVYLSEADCWSSRPRGFHRICVHRPLPERFRQ